MFLGLWISLQELIRAGDLRASEEVKYELQKKDDAVLEWASVLDGSCVPIDDATQEAVSAILADHPCLIDTRRGRSGAGPFVIALAKVRGYRTRQSPGMCRGRPRRGNR